MHEFSLETYLQQLSASKSIEDAPKVPIPTIQKNQNYLFISYSHRDYKAVYSDLAHLYSRGIRFWYDKGLSVGKDWEQEVKAHIKHPNCCGIIFYISTNMFLSNSVLKEIEFTLKRKKGKIIHKKNYFCVNLHNGNITDILFEAQKIQKEHGLPLLDTKAVNTLTSTFSDQDTYITANNRFHLDDLIAQIQSQFDVTSKTDTSFGQPGFLTVDSTSAAVRTFFEGKVPLIPLCKYLYACYREDNKTQPWYLIPTTAAVGLAIMIRTLTLVLSAPDIPYIPYILAYCSKPCIISLAALFCGTLFPYILLTLFWLYYFTPVYRKCERNPKFKIIHAIVFVCDSVLAAFLVPVAYIMLLVLFAVFFETVSTLNQSRGK